LFGVRPYLLRFKGLNFFGLVFTDWCFFFLSSDLIAVLCPFGPLKILVESSRNQNQEVPALLYTVNAVWFMASPPNSILDREADKTSGAIDFENLTSDQSNSHAFAQGHGRATGRDGGSISSAGASSRNSGLDSSFAASGISRASSSMALVPMNSNLDDFTTGQSRDNIELRERQRSGPSPGRSQGQDDGSRQRSGPSRRSEDGEERGEDNNEDEDDDDDGGGLKLGLGDFVFYSVLIARAGMDQPCSASLSLLKKGITRCEILNELFFI